LKKNESFSGVLKATMLKQKPITLLVHTYSVAAVQSQGRASRVTDTEEGRIKKKTMEMLVCMSEVNGYPGRFIWKFKATQRLNHNHKKVARITIPNNFIYFLFVKGLSLL
jgi:hypothetical protein